jgi:hypothetical protein
VRSNIVIVSSIVLTRIVFLAIVIVLDPLSLLTLRLTITVSSYIRLELFRIAIGRSKLIRGLY